MNKELFSLRTSESAQGAVGFLLALGITGAPALDEDGRPVGFLSLRDVVQAVGDETVADRMSKPAATVRSGELIEAAARRLADSGRRHLVVVDDDGRAAGMVSAVDLLRGVMGMPASHPDAFPHFDRVTGASWTDDAPLELDHATAAPEGPGVLVLVHGGLGVVERIVWAEPCENVRARVYDLLSAPQEDAILARALGLGQLRFRAASVGDFAARNRVVEAVQGQAMGALRPVHRGAA